MGKRSDAVNTILLSTCSIHLGIAILPEEAAVNDKNSRRRCIKIWKTIDILPSYTKILFRLHERKKITFFKKWFNRSISARKENCIDRPLVFYKRDLQELQKTKKDSFFVVQRGT